MKIYHIDDTTGEAVSCASVEKCSKNKSEKDHYPTPEEARENRDWTFKVKAPRFAGQRSGYASLKTIFRRVATDKVFAESGGLILAWRVALKHFDGLCYLCGKPLYNKKTAEELGTNPGEKATADHIVPPGAGGSTTAGNLAPAHQKCNSERDTTPIEEFLKDSPEMLSRVRSFQKKFKYKPATAQQMKELNDALEIIWDGVHAQIETLARKI